MDNTSYIERKALFPPMFDSLAEGIAGLKGLQEIRIRCNRPIRVLCGNHEYMVNHQGARCQNEASAFWMQQEDMDALLSHLCHYSIYAYEEEIRQGYLTMAGGHRVGIAGQAVVRDDGIVTIHPVASINIRIAHEKIGCANLVLPYLYLNHHLCNTLIVSPPACGKTTLLRDLIRQISDGGVLDRGRNVGVVDERSEIGGTYRGRLCNDLGSRTDVMDACPKSIGMMLLIRSMNPDVIAVDELGSTTDMIAMQQVISCGCKVIATVHGSGIEDLYRKRYLEEIMKEKIFERIVLLGKQNGAGTLLGIYDENAKPLSDNATGQLL